MTQPDDTLAARRVRGRTSQRKGREFEWRVQRLLEGLGWDVVRSSGSHGPADIYGWSHPNRVLWAIQCKGARSTLGPAEREAWLAHCARINALPVLAQPLVRGIRWRAWAGDHWVGVNPQDGGWVT